MAGMKVVLVKCDEKENIDFSRYKRKKAAAHANDLGQALMGYLSSTHGVF